MDCACVRAEVIVFLRCLRLADNTSKAGLSLSMCLIPCCLIRAEEKMMQVLSISEERESAVDYMMHLGKG